MSGSLDLCGAARCTVPTTSGIHVAGGSSVLQLPASAGCQHAVPSLGEIRTILSGSWLMVCGSSNSRIQFLHYANSILAGSVDFLWPPSWSEDESPNWNAMKWYEWADVVYDVSDPTAPTRTHIKVGMLDQTEWTSMMADAPQHDAHLLRLSYGHSSYFPDCGTWMQESFAAPNGWAAAPTVSLLNAGQWSDVSDVNDFLPNARPN